MVENKNYKYKLILKKILKHILNLFLTIITKIILNEKGLIATWGILLKNTLLKRIFLSLIIFGYDLELNYMYIILIYKLVSSIYKNIFNNVIYSNDLTSFTFFAGIFRLWGGNEVSKLVIKTLIQIIKFITINCITPYISGGLLEYTQITLDILTIFRFDSYKENIFNNATIKIIRLMEDITNYGLSYLINVIKKFLNLVSNKLKHLKNKVLKHLKNLFWGLLIKINNYKKKIAITLFNYMLNLFIRVYIKIRDFFDDFTNKVKIFIYKLIKKIYIITLRLLLKIKKILLLIIILSKNLLNFFLDLNIKPEEPAYILEAIKFLKSNKEKLLKSKSLKKINKEQDFKGYKD